MEARVKSEIFGLHQFFQDWFSGKVEESKKLFDEKVSSHFEPSFEFVMPDGTHMTKDETVSSLRDAYGSDPDFKIEVRFRSFEPFGTMSISLCTKSYKLKRVWRIDGYQLQYFNMIRVAQTK